MKNGRYAMRLLSDFISHMSTDITCVDFCRQATALVRQEYVRAGADFHRLDRHPEERLTASAVIYSHFWREVWMVGDCQCMVDGKRHENGKPSEQANALKRGRVIKKLLDQGMTTTQLQQHDLGRDAILPDIIAACQGQNKQYAVIDGYPIPQEYVKIIPSSSHLPLVLASDGYPFLKSTLAESEQALASLLQHDPLCIHDFHATKGLMRGNRSFDDRAYIRFVD